MGSELLLSWRTAVEAPPVGRPRRGGWRLITALIVLLFLVVQVVISLSAGSPPRRIPTAKPLPDRMPVEIGDWPWPPRPAEATDAREAGVVFVQGVTSSGVAYGTGIIIRADGLVLTNYHVVAKTQSLSVQSAADGMIYPASLLGRNAWADVALLQLSGAQELPTVTVDDEGVAVGDEVIAVGNAGGEQVLVASNGRITGLDTTAEVPSIFGRDGTDQLTGLIESDVAAVAGYSGGPTFDAEYEVIGLTSAGRETAEPHPISYTIPISVALAISDEILADRQSEQTRVGPGAYLGITVAPGEQAQVVEVVAAGPAEAAGLRPGAIITGFNRRPISRIGDLLRALESSDPGERIELGWLDADGVPRSGIIVLGTSPTN